MTIRKIVVESTAKVTSGRFTTRFSLTERPAQKVWWGVALWDDGAAEDGSEFNEINFGYTTDQSFTNTQLRFESARRGNDVSLKIDTEEDQVWGSCVRVKIVES